MGNTQNALLPPDRVSPPVMPERSYPEELSADSALSRVVGSAAFASVLPRIQAALEGLEQAPGLGMLDTLADNITRLQDSFMQDLYEGMHTMNADTSAKLTLRLDGEARLRASQEHPDCGTLNELFSRNPEFSAAFAEIAAQSAALRDLRRLHTVSACASPAHSCRELALRPGEPVYQLSLKGDMSHFYFAR